MKFRIIKQHNNTYIIRKKVLCFWFDLGKRDCHKGYISYEIFEFVRSVDALLYILLHFNGIENIEYK